MANAKAIVDKQKCVGCGACTQVCPVQAIKIVVGWKSTVDWEKCIGCGRCTVLCHRKAVSLIDS
ncbi:MAG: 4Fe-4S binding protein [Oscillospiraceae bacterium]|nr:4Fe-4S binding protein [Oscillospiraceae bacterium]